MNQVYKETIAVLERMHRQCLYSLKRGLENRGIYEISNVQGLILYNVGDDQLTVGELTQKGCYHGSNVSYNLKKTGRLRVANLYAIAFRSSQLSR